MPAVTTHAPGTFCWPELASSDREAAIAFYAKLFGWTSREVQGDAGPYHLMLLDGRVAAGLYELPPGMRASGVPSHWASYVSVESADAAAARAAAAGGTRCAGPFDVGAAGRVAVLQDPLRAYFNVWEGRERAGVEVLGEPGALGWTQFNARDPGAAKTFYAGLFGWEAQDVPLHPGVAYTTFLRDGAPAAGMLPMPADVPDGTPSHWLSYFCSARLGESFAKAVSLGAEPCVAPTEIPGGGALAVLADPQGAVFGLMTAM